MKKRAICLILSALLAALSLAGCSLPDIITSPKKNTVSGNVEQLFAECPETTGKWVFHDFETKEPDGDTYLEFDGAKGVMYFSYYEDGALKREGAYRVVYRGEEASVSIPLGIGLEIKGDAKHRDWLNCFVKDFKGDFTQFTVMSEERELDFNEVTGTPQARVYRLGEMPVKYGTYVKEGREIVDVPDYREADCTALPAGVYVHESGAKFTFAHTYPLSTGLLFCYEYDGKTTEGVYMLATDRDKLFLWIDYDIGFKPTRQQKEEYEMGSGQDFPPNYNVYGTFEASPNRPFTISRFTPIEGYGYDPAVCDLQTGVYVRLQPNAGQQGEQQQGEQQQGEQQGRQGQQQQ